MVDQVAQFKQFLAPKPAGAQWSSDNTLFAIWIGINDVVSPLFPITPESVSTSVFRVIPLVGYAPFGMQLSSA